MVESERQEIQTRLAAEQLRGLVDFARDVLKLVTLINGGAAIALLAFLQELFGLHKVQIQASMEV